MIVMLVLFCNLVGKCRAGRHLFCFLKDGVQTGHAHKQSTVCNAHERTIVRRQRLKAEAVISNDLERLPFV